MKWFSIFEKVINCFIEKKPEVKSSSWKWVRKWLELWLSFISSLTFGFMKDMYVVLYQFLKTRNEGDDKIADLVEEYNEENMKVGWDMTLNISKMINIILAVIIYSISDSPSLRRRWVWVVSMNFTFYVIFNFLWK